MGTSRTVAVKKKVHNLRVSGNISLMVLWKLFVSTKIGWLNFNCRKMHKSALKLPSMSCSSTKL